MFVDIAEKKWENCVRGFMKDNSNGLIIGACIVIAAIIISATIIFSDDPFTKCKKNMMKDGWDSKTAMAICVEAGR